MVHFVGAGPGGPDLITLRGAELLKQADCVVYAGSLVNPALLGFVREGVPVYNSAHMTLEQVLEVLEQAERAGGNTVRLHTGDPCLYGAVREQMDQLDRRGIPWDVTPGVSSFCGAAAAAGVEYTLPGVSQSVIITRMAGRTPVPEGESIAALAQQGIQMIYDETHMVLAQGNFVLAVSEGTYGGEPTSYYDLWRVENDKITEHWDVMETIADQSTWQNDNGKF